MSKIKHQIKLPLRVAVQVVMQGIRVRFGRSVVTIMGVMLGIAFLMAILTGQVIKTGVSAETQQRQEVQRSYNILVAEMGPPRGRVVGIILVGPLNDLEERLLKRLAQAQPETVRVHFAQPGIQLPNRLQSWPGVSLDDVGEDANALLVVGDGEAADLDLATALANARYRLLGVTRRDYQLDLPENVRTASLQRELREDEIKRRQAEARKARFRNVWIIVISMLVTVIGITNSMLMSVTERFREIGTMKCLGALSAFIRQLFLIESSLIGGLGAVTGALVGMLFSLLVYTISYGGLVYTSLDYLLLFIYFVFASIVGIVLSVLAAIYPATFASRMLPAHALRSNI